MGCGVYPTTRPNQTPNAVVIGLGDRRRVIISVVKRRKIQTAS